MDDGLFKQIEKHADSENVKSGLSYSDLIGKQFVLGQTRYVCRWGTLSDGHEKITDSQRYRQALKEAYGISKNIKLNKILAMKAEADRLEAQDNLDKLLGKWKKPTESEILRAKAYVQEAEEKLNTALDNITDQLRMLDEYEKVRRELEPEVLSKYPGGIEQSEKDDWSAVLEYRTKVAKVNRDTMPHYVPMDPVSKAEFGVQTKNPELTAWLEVSEKKVINELCGGNVKVALDMHREYVKNLEQKQMQGSNKENLGG